jgi:Na+/phosphate symporter
MKDLQESLTSKILPKEIVDQSQTAIKMVKYYAKVSDIIERTHLAMGKKSTFKIESSSTTNQKLNTNTYGSTHQNLSRI